MALDKLVDSAQLDGALTATANAIRVKTGDSGTIAWNSSTGFANAVGDIQAGATVTALSVTENGTYTAPSGTAYSPVTVSVVGSVEPVESGVEFFDYEGTLLYSYTTSQALQLTALPNNPSHEGLIAQGWNWSLADIKSYLTNYPDAILSVGQMYITDDGTTRIYINLGERKSPMLGICIKGTVDVDWGDGTAHSTLTGMSLSTVTWTETHNYATGGKYVIKLTVTGEARFSGVSSQNQWSCILRDAVTGNYKNIYYMSSIYKIEVGANITGLNNNSFYNCESLESITLPSTVRIFSGNYGFAYCYSLKNIVIPDGATAINSYYFIYCYRLENVELPKTITTMGSYVFQYCRSLLQITIPPNISILTPSEFEGCHALKHITLYDEMEMPSYNTPSNCFAECYSLRKIQFPSSFTIIPSAMFKGCISLSSVTIPSAVTELSNQAFYNCYGVIEYHLLGTTPPTISGTTFSNYSADCIFYVPYSSDHSILAAYKGASNWGSLESRIQEEPQ